MYYNYESCIVGEIDTTIIPHGMYLLRKDRYSLKNMRDVTAVVPYLL